MTTTSNRRFHLPRVFARKDARCAIYKAMYGQGSNNYNTPAFDSSRHHADVDKIDWFSVKSRLMYFWKEAAFDSRTAVKIINDFNTYAKGKVTLVLGELV